LVDGNPGAGKTTLALQFLREGVRSGETCLYVTLWETPEALQAGCGPQKLCHAQGSAREYS
jgi:circadian clock protein KaiC